MIVFVIVDSNAGDRNSWGFFIMKDADGQLYFGCEEYIMKTTSLQAALDWKASASQDWTDWSPKDNLRPAIAMDIQQAGLGSYVTGELDTKTSLWIWRRESGTV